MQKPRVVQSKLLLLVSMAVMLLSPVTSFTSVRPARTVMPSQVPRIASQLYSSIPEPGPCPECGDENTYWDGSTLFICTNCEHEWAVDGIVEEVEDDEDVTRDVNGNVLEQGDTCVLTQDLAKGKLKKGLKVKIRLGDYGGGHDCEASIKGVGTYALKSQFLKKV